MYIYIVTTFVLFSLLLPKELAVSNKKVKDLFGTSTSIGRSKNNLAPEEKEAHPR